MKIVSMTTLIVVAAWTLVNCKSIVTPEADLMAGIAKFGENLRGIYIHGDQVYRVVCKEDSFEEAYVYAKCNHEDPKTHVRFDQVPLEKRYRPALQKIIGIEGSGPADLAELKKTLERSASARDRLLEQHFNDQTITDDRARQAFDEQLRFLTETIESIQARQQSAEKDSELYKLENTLIALLDKSNQQVFNVVDQNGGLLDRAFDFAYGSGGFATLDVEDVIALRNTPKELARVFHSTAVFDNKMIIWGGVDSRTRLNDGWAYDFSSQRWERLPPAPPGLQARSRQSAVVFENKMIIWGGFDGRSTLNDGWAYDVSDQIWKQLPPVPASLKRQIHSAVVFDNKMVIWGGFDGSSALNDGWAYDFSSQTWERLPSAPSNLKARHAHSAVVFSEKMIIWGGADSSSKFNDGWAYDFSSKRWERLPSAPSNLKAREGHSAVIFSDKMIIWGGYDGSVMRNDGWVFDFSSQRWEPLPSAPSGLLGRHSYSAVVFDNKMVIWGGSDGSSHLNDGWVYDISNGRWLDP